MFCQTCGNPVEDTATVCPNCGAAITPLEQPAADPAAQANAQSAYEQPAYEQPAYEQPVYEQPEAQQQAYQQPGYQQSAYQQPGYQQPGYQQPGYGQPPYGQPYEQPVGEPKSKVAAGLLAIFLGSLGIHNFYLGFNKRGLIQLLVSLLTCGIGAAPMGIWALVEGILYLAGSSGYTTDANGVPLKD